MENQVNVKRPKGKRKPWRKRKPKEEHLQRGPVPGVMTHNRQRILNEYLKAAEAGEKVSLRTMARRTGINNHSNVRRTLRDLKRYGHLPEKGE